MTKPIGFFLISTLCLVLYSCSNVQHNDELFQTFQNPEADARPMVRWWWNGNCVEADEIKRELAVMKKAGIGGVEINSIAMPPQAKQINVKPLQWAGKEWCEMVKVASLEARELGMITDLIVGSGWPFGGRFLNEDETMQRLGIKRHSVKANTSFEIDLNEFLKFKSFNTPGTIQIKEHSDVELVTAKLVPVNISDLNEVIDITSEVKENKLSYKGGDKDYELVFVYNERNFKSVYHGSPGAAGPIMDHYKTEAVLGYLNRLKVLEQETSLPLAELVRALFCDSIELGGSNWTDDMKEQFFQRNGYDIMPWLPFVLQPAKQPNKYEISDEMADAIQRIQYDFYNTIITVFLERFTTEFQKFCTENGVLCRYQAYGTPFYMGLFQGNMIPDIPESNNWIYSRGRNEAEPSDYIWNRNHGYMLWNKAASSAAHIAGKKITSNEAMTNTSGVFRTSLETVKQSDDMNFITGMNHTVLHGYNYSPPEAGFPGWIRYGAYFSEQNTWWKYFKNWADYNARLSSIFQNSKPTADIAILSRVRDYWGNEGLTRTYLNDKPWYYARLWEPISNLGSSCDYIHQPVLESAEVVDNELVCGEMKYKAVFLTNVSSLTPGAAQKLNEFAKAGGAVVFIESLPNRSLSYKDAVKNDEIINKVIKDMLALENVIQLDAPKESEDFIAWTKDVMSKINLNPHVEISNPVSHLYSMKQTTGNQDIYFFSNSERKKPIEFEATFTGDKKFPYLWNPETGKRYSLSYLGKNKLHIKLDALESALIVFEPSKINVPEYQFSSIPENFSNLETTWDVKFEHGNGTVFNRSMKQLIDFKDADDETLTTFAGTVTYSCDLENTGNIKYIRLSEVNEAVTELYINGKRAGMKWYGNHCYKVDTLLKEGTNKIEIKLTNTLANYCRSLTDDATASHWTRNYKTPFSSGLTEVELGN